MTGSALHMLRLDPDLQMVTRWAATEGIQRAGADDGYVWHALLKAAFGAHAPRPFQVVDRSRTHRSPQLLGYCSADEATLREHAGAFADPLAASALGLDTLAVKRMPETFTAGQRLGFEVRVRPTVRQDRDGDRTRSRERDAFLAAVDKSGPRGSRDDLKREDVYRDWLGDRLAAGGGTLLACRLVALRRARLSRRNQERELVSVGERGGGPDATFAGTLQVADPDRFGALLARGVGRHRAFGFGMLLLKPARGG